VTNSTLRRRLDVVEGRIRAGWKERYLAELAGAELLLHNFLSEAGVLEPLPAGVLAKQAVWKREIFDGWDPADRAQCQRQIEGLSNEELTVGLISPAWEYLRIPGVLAGFGRPDSLELLLTRLRESAHRPDLTVENAGAFLRKAQARLAARTPPDPGETDSLPPL
jgi:hypothetical protein